MLFRSNSMTQLFTRFPPVSPFREFRASSACKLEREREKSMPVKLRTERVGESLASTTLITPVHTWNGLPYLSVPFRCSGAPLRRNPSPAGAEPNLSPTSLTGALKRVEMCNSLLGCVRVDTCKSQDNGTTQIFTRFPPVSPFREFRASSACKLERERERERERSRCT